MSELLDLISGIGELILSWRFYLCAIPAISVTMMAFAQLQNQLLAWLIAVPVMLAGIVGGFMWQARAP